jgi:hypothetical protein
MFLRAPKTGSVVCLALLLTDYGSEIKRQGQSITLGESTTEDMNTYDSFMVGVFPNDDVPIAP